MPYRLTKIYTRKGDDGYTHLGDHRIPKDDLLVEAVGDVDELNSFIGFVASLPIKNAEIADCLLQIQNDLFDLGGELHVQNHPVINEEKVTYLEKILDAWNKQLPPLKEFVLPRGNQSCAAAHLARAVCRRTERSIVRLHRQVALHNPQIIRYLNRLSDLLFVMARKLALEGKAQEILWQHETEK